MLAHMTKARSPFFALQARGNVAGLRASPRRTLGQVFRALHSNTYTITAPQREIRVRHRLMTQAWQTLYVSAPNHFAWDLRRRYLSRPGTGYSEFLSAHLSLRLHGRDFLWLTSPTILRDLVPGFLLLGIRSSGTPDFVVAWYTLTPGGQSYGLGLTETSPSNWTAFVPDRWPSRRTWASFAACYTGALAAGISGYATT